MSVCVCVCIYTYTWQRSPLMPLVVQKHLPLLELHMLAWPLHLHAANDQQNTHTAESRSNGPQKSTVFWHGLVFRLTLTAAPICGITIVTGDAALALFACGEVLASLTHTLVDARAVSVTLARCTRRGTDRLNCYI